MTFNQLLAEQDGIVSVQQAAELGISRKTLCRQVAAGHLLRVGHGVYRSSQHPATHEARLRAAVLAAGRLAVASGPSAAWWHGLTEPPSRCWMTIPVKRRALLNTAHQVRRRTIPPAHRTTVRRLAVTALPLTVLEAAVILPGGSVVMDQALQTRVNLEALRAAHVENAGRTGTAAAEKLLVSAESGGRSEAERLFHRLLRQAEIVGWSAQLSIAGYATDVAFPHQRVVIEIDGWAFHRDARRFSNDLERQNAIQNAGWRVLRFDWHRIVNDSKGVVAEVRAAVRE